MDYDDLKSELEMRISQLEKRVSECMQKDDEYENDIELLTEGFSHYMEQIGHYQEEIVILPNDEERNDVCCKFDDRTHNLFLQRKDMLEEIDHPDADAYDVTIAQHDY